MNNSSHSICPAEKQVENQNNFTCFKIMSENIVKSYQKIDSNILDSFWNLCSKDIKIRVNASADILLSLTEKQAEVENENALCQDLEYCIERLVKGVASPRDAARLGFCLLLSQILKKLDVVQVEEVLELMNKHLVITGKQDKRDIIFGRLFAYIAIVRSGRLANHPYLSYVVSSLYDLCEGKSYILKSVYEIMVHVFSQVSVENFKDKVWNPLKKKLPKDWDNSSADTFWLLLLSLRLFPSSISVKYLKNHWASNDIFAAENLNYLKKLIKQTSSCLPILHPFCCEFLLLIKERKDFNEIWTSVVDDNLFDIEGRDKAFIGFKMVELTLQSSPTKKIVRTVFSPKFRTVFSKSYLSSKHPLNPAANQMAEFLCAFVKETTVPDIQITVLKAFLQPPQTLLIDTVLKKKEVSLIIQNLLPDAVKAFSEILKSVLLKKKFSIEEKKVNNMKRFQAVQQLGNLVAHPNILSDIDWRMDTIRFLFLYAFFNVKEVTSEIPHCDKLYDPLPDSLQEACMNAFFKATHSLHIRIQNSPSPLTIFLQQLIVLTEYADLLMNSTDSVESLFTVEKIKTSWSHMNKMVHKLSKQGEKHGLENLSHAFQALFLQLGFQLFHDTSHIPEILEELYVCCKKALKTSKSDADEPPDEPPWIGVVIDILLSLLSKSSRNLRSLVTFVFPLFCPFIDDSALHQILDIIYPEKEGEDVLVDDTDDEEKNIEFGTGSSSDDSEQDSNMPQVDKEFRKKIQQALGPAAEDSDAESVYLSDSEMFKLDDALSHVFKSRMKSGHSQFQTEEKSLLHFRVRCCDLILAFIKSEPPMNLALKCIDPIIAAYEFGHRNKHQSPLLLKTLHVLQALTKLRKFQHHEDVSKSDLKMLLDAIMQKCHKEIDMSAAKKLYNLCVFLVLCFRKLEATNLKSSKTPSYLSTYLSSLSTFVSGGNSNLLPQFFTSLMEACPDLAWNFVEPCSDYAFSGDVRLFKKTQCLGILSEALKYSKGQKIITNNQWLEFGSSILPQAIESLKSALENADMKPVHVTELLHVIFTTHTIIQEKTGKSLLKDYVDLLPILNDCSSAKLKKVNSKGRTLKNKIINCLGGNLNQNKKSGKSQKKRQLQEPENDGEDLLNGDVTDEDVDMNEKNLVQNKKTQKLQTPKKDNEHLLNGDVTVQSPKKKRKKMSSSGTSVIDID